MHPRTAPRHAGETRATLGLLRAEMPPSPGDVLQLLPRRFDALPTSVIGGHTFEERPRARRPTGHGAEQRERHVLEEANLALRHAWLLPVHEEGRRQAEGPLLVALEEKLFLDSLHPPHVRFPTERHVPQISTLERHLHEQRGVLLAPGPEGGRRVRAQRPAEGVHDEPVVGHVRGEHRRLHEPADPAELLSGEVAQEVALRPREHLHGRVEMMPLVRVPAPISCRAGVAAPLQELVRHTQMLEVVQRRGD
mmetsp:Transcript_18660/g.55760  ORF Transcript_18660/g.55760 Transcript_18660/m.55760 type:complete len:251 (-) Transcript_18660:527-1279(-)